MFAGAGRAISLEASEYYGMAELLIGDPWPSPARDRDPLKCASTMSGVASSGDGLGRRATELLP
jgi:hypothetical protein